MIYRAKMIAIHPNLDHSRRTMGNPKHHINNLIIKFSLTKLIMIRMQGHCLKRISHLTKCSKMPLKTTKLKGIRDKEWKNRNPRHLRTSWRRKKNMTRRRLYRTTKARFPKRTLRKRGYLKSMRNLNQKASTRLKIMPLKLKEPLSIWRGSPSCKWKKLLTKQTKQFYHQVSVKDYSGNMKRRKDSSGQKQDELLLLMILNINH